MVECRVNGSMYAFGSISTAGVVCCNELNSGNALQLFSPTDHEIILYEGIIYKGNQRMSILLQCLEGESEYTLQTKVLCPGKKDRIFNTPLPRDRCPPSKSYGVWVMERLKAKRVAKLRKEYTEKEGEEGYKEPMRLSMWETQQVTKSTKILMPKLDGVRCVAHPDGRLVSRGNKLYSVPHVQEAIIKLALEYPLDGELYIHGIPFDELSGMARRGGDDKLQFHVFDLVELKLPYKDRYAKLMDMDLPFPLELVDAMVTTDNPSIWLKSYTNAGYEGIVIRSPNGKYEYKRSKTSWKLKPLFDEEFPIINFRSDLSPSGSKMIKYICWSDRGNNDFEVVPSTTHQERMRLYQSAMLHPATVVGKKLTVEHRGYNTNGLPVHAIGKGVRDYE